MMVVVSANRRFLTIAAFFMIYVIWGSNYIAIRFAIASIPPFIMAGTRFFVAGLIIYIWCILHGAPKLSKGQWWSAIKVGFLLNVGGTGALIWAEQHVPSGLASIFWATFPLWFVLLDRSSWNGYANKRLLILGLCTGFAGVMIMSGSNGIASLQDSSFFYIGLLVLNAGLISWIFGSFLSRRITLTGSLQMNLAMQMLSAGTILMIISVLFREWGSFSVAQISLNSYLALIHLILFGAILGYMAYIWLLKTQPSAMVGIYAYVNPVVAVFLGWWLAKEPFTWQTFVSLILILAGVLLDNKASRQAKADQPKRKR